VGAIITDVAILVLVGAALYGCFQAGGGVAGASAFASSLVKF
jgi:hypothetical protein